MKIYGMYTTLPTRLVALVKTTYLPIILSITITKFSCFLPQTV